MSFAVTASGGGGAPPLVTELAVVLVGAALVGYLCQRIGLIPIVGYLAAGAVLGPNALGIVSSTELVDQAAEIGVIFLLFAIGLELSGDQLKRMGPLMFGGGALQVLLTIGVVVGLSLAAGIDIKSGIYTGCLVALSSTAVVLKILASRGTTGSPTGQVAVAFLIFQDIAVVVMVLVVPLLGDGGGSAGDIVSVLARSAVIIVVVLVATRRLVPGILAAVSRRTNEEEFLLAILAIAVGIAWLVTLFGLSASLGAFIAGLVVSSGPHRERATRYVEPFQVLFAAIFFASIGMLLDPQFLIENLPEVVTLVVVIIIVKVLTAGLAARLLRQPWPVVAASGLLLAQLGEFAFVLEKSGREAGLTPFGEGETGSQTFVAASVVLFAITPAFYAAGQRILAATARRKPVEAARRAVVLADAARGPRISEMVKAADPDIEVSVADGSALSGPTASPQRMRVDLLVVDASAGEAVASVVRDALTADPPVPTIIRAGVRLDLDDVSKPERLNLVIDEVLGDDELARRIAKSLHSSGQSG